MSDKITVRLSSAGIDKAINQLKGYSDEIDRRVSILIARMVVVGQKYAISAVGSTGTGDAKVPISGYRSKDRGVIVAGGNAIWLEFGTGVYYNGPKGSYPNPLGETTPGIVGIGEYGQGHGANPFGWWFWEGNTLRHTFGVPAQKFMYNTIQELKARFPQMAKEVFEA